MPNKVETRHAASHRGVWEARISVKAVFGVRCLGKYCKGWRMVFTDYKSARIVAHHLRTSMKAIYILLAVVQLLIHSVSYSNLSVPVFKKRMLADENYKQAHPEFKKLIDEHIDSFVHTVSRSQLCYENSEMRITYRQADNPRILRLVVSRHKFLPEHFEGGGRPEAGSGGDTPDYFTIVPGMLYGLSEEELDYAHALIKQLNTNFHYLYTTPINVFDFEKTLAGDYAGQVQPLMLLHRFDRTSENSPELSPVQLRVVTDIGEPFYGDMACCITKVENFCHKVIETTKEFTFPEPTGNPKRIITVIQNLATGAAISIRDANEWILLSCIYSKTQLKDSLTRQAIYLSQLSQKLAGTPTLLIPVAEELRRQWESRARPLLRSKYLTSGHFGKNEPKNLEEGYKLQNKYPVKNEFIPKKVKARDEPKK